MNQTETQTIDDRINDWHDSDTTLPLWEYLGWTKEQYTHWVETDEVPVRKESRNRKPFRRRAYVKAMKPIKRKAREGEKIVIVKPHYNEQNFGYKIGDMFIVKDVFFASVHTTTGLALWDDEYRVLQN